MGSDFIGRFIIQLLACVVVGGIIGIFNHVRGKNTGPRTFILITVGSTLVTIISMGFFQNIGHPWQADPARLAAQTISALGFLGSGVIWLADDRQVKGLTTAAALWLSAILGILIGAASFSNVAAAVAVLMLGWLLVEYYLWYRKQPREP